MAKNEDYMQQGKALRDAGEKEKAMDKFIKAIEKEPNNHMYLLEIAKINVNWEHYDVAIRYYKKAHDLVLATKNPVLISHFHCNIAHVYLLKEQYGLAIRNNNLAIQSNGPKDSTAVAYYSNAHCLNKLHQFQDAMLQIDKALELEPANKEFLNYKDVISRNLNDRQASDNQSGYVERENDRAQQRQKQGCCVLI